MDNEIIVALIGAGATVAVTLGNVLLTNRLNNRKKNDELRENIAVGVQSLLRAEIIRSNEKYTERGHCPIYAKEALKRQYTAYHNLGGNDIATKLYEECIALPERPKEEHENEN